MTTVSRMAFLSARTVQLIANLVLFSQLGVLTRVFLTKLFVLGCDGGWGPCLAQGGIALSSLPSNMLGSFIIGLVADCRVIGFESERSLALLPADHPWQFNTELIVAVRTGYCGSLTTFGTWMADSLTAAMDENQWLNAVFEILVGLFSSICSYIVGMHVALCVSQSLGARDLSRGEEKDILQARAQFFQEEVDDIVQEKDLSASAHYRTPVERQILEEEPDVPRIVRHASHHPSGGVVRPPDIEESLHEPSPDSLSSRGSTSKHRRKETLTTNSLMMKNGVSPSKKTEENLFEDKELFFRIRSVTDLFLWILLICSTVGLCMGAVYVRPERDDDGLWLRKAWFSALLGPCGCLVRWYLSKLNYTSKVCIWLPLGTLIANTSGTAIDFGLNAVTSRVALGYWPSLIVSAISTGAMGSLTTVSTFVTELVKMGEVLPEDAHAYIYAAMTFGAALLSGLVIYGWAAWSS